MRAHDRRCAALGSVRYLGPGADSCPSPPAGLQYESALLWEVTGLMGWGKHWERVSTRCLPRRDFNGRFGWPWVASKRQRARGRAPGGRLPCLLCCDFVCVHICGAARELADTDAQRAGRTALRTRTHADAPSPCVLRHPQPNLLRAALLANGTADGCDLLVGGINVTPALRRAGWVFTVPTFHDGLQIAVAPKARSS